MECRKRPFPHSAVNNTAGFNRRMRKTARPVVWRGNGRNPVTSTRSWLSDLIHRLTPGEDLVIIENNRPLAELIRLPAEKLHPVPGRCKGMLTVLAEDDEYLQDWPEATLEIQPFHWDQVKQYTDPEADDFTLMLKTLRDRDRQIEAARFSSFWSSIFSPRQLAKVLNRINHVCRIQHLID